MASTSLREAVARQCAALGKKIAAWEQRPGEDARAGISLMKAQVLAAHSALQADDVLTLVAIKEEIAADHKNLDDFS